MTVSENLMRAKQRRQRKAKARAAAYPAARLVNSLPGRVALVALITIAAALGCALLLRSRLALPYAVLRWTAAALLGMAAGLAARALLAGRTAALRLWAALLALLAGLATLGLMGRGAAGAATGASLPAAAQAQLNWTWLVQFALGAGLAWLTLHAFPVALPESPRPRKRTTAARPRSPGAARKKSAPKRPAADRDEKQPDSVLRAKPERKPAPKNTARAAQTPSRSRSGAIDAQAAAQRSPRTQSGAAQTETPAESGAAPPPPSSAGRVRTGSAAGRSPAVRRRAVIHPESTPVTRTLWTRPPAAPPRRAAPARRASSPSPQTPDLAQLWQGVNRRLQTWRHGALGSGVDAQDDPSPSPAARTVQPRRPARAATQPAAVAQPAPAARRASAERRRSAAERIRAVGEALPAWRIIKERIRPNLGRPRPTAQPVAAQPASPVRLLGEEEHRCPFCLELVEPGDGRGVVECSICHTRHHADCWAVTGACQVPHYHG